MVRLTKKVLFPPLGVDSRGPSLDLSGSTSRNMSRLISVPHMVPQDSKIHTRPNATLLGGLMGLMFDRSDLGSSPSPLLCFKKRGSIGCAPYKNELLPE
jgi:hypothetical protein